MEHVHMASLPTYFSRENLLRLAVAAVIALASVIAVTGAIAVAAPASATPAPTVAAADPVEVADSANAAPSPTWDRLAQCESNGNWAANTRNGFSGGLQFTPSTWRAYGGQGDAHTATRAQQITVAERVLVDQGWAAWPACSAKLGLR
jgi:resuscitation-promoting factor RpfA